MGKAHKRQRQSSYQATNSKIQNNFTTDDQRQIFINSVNDAVARFARPSSNSSLGLTAKALWQNLVYDLQNAALQIPLVRNALLIPIQDALGGWFEISNKNSSFSEEDISVLERALKTARFTDREDDLSSVLHDIMYKAALFGSAVIIFEESNCQGFDTPLNKDAMQDGFRIHVKEPQYVIPEFNIYTNNQIDITVNNKSEYPYTIGGTKIHHSRVRQIDYQPASTYYERSQSRGFGISMLQSALADIKQYIETANHLMKQIGENRIKVLQVDGLHATADMAQKMDYAKASLSLAVNTADNRNSLVIGTEDNFKIEQTDVEAMSRVMHSFDERICASLSIPPIKILTVSRESGSFSSSSETQIEQYNKKINSVYRRNMAEKVLAMVIDMTSRIIFGRSYLILEDYEIQWAELKEVTVQEAEFRKNSIFNRALSLVQTRQITPKEFAETVNAENLLPIALDVLQISDDFEDYNFGEGDIVTSEGVTRLGTKQGSFMSNDANTFQNSFEILSKK